MDSLTQVTLGAAIGTAVLGHRIGYRAAIWGGVCGTLPDLDVLIPYADPVAEFTYHRSFSHSLLVLSVLAPLLVWLIIKLHPDTARYRRSWFYLVWLALITHPLLDSFTIYGTQIFWPMSEYPVGLGSVFIIDPAYTLPLLLGMLLTLRRKPTFMKPPEINWNRVGLVLSSLYLCWSLVAQHWATQQARQSLAQQNKTYREILVTPAPFNTLLWRIVAKDEQRYYEGFYSLLDRRQQVVFKRYSSDEALLATLQEHWPVTRLRWFTKGLYKVESQQEAVLMTDLRMGVEPHYVFVFKVAEGNLPQAVATERPALVRDFSRLPDLMRRIWDEQAY